MVFSTARGNSVSTLTLSELRKSYGARILLFKTSYRLRLPVAMKTSSSRVKYTRPGVAFGLASSTYGNAGRGPSAAGAE